MNIIDAVLSGVIGIQVIIGFFNGFLRKAVDTCIFLASAFAAYLYYKKGESPFKIALAFWLTIIVLHVIFWCVRKSILKGKVSPTLYSRAGGGIIGACVGVVQILVALVFLHLLNGIFGSADSGFSRALNASFFYTRYKAMSINSAVPGVQKAYQIGEALKMGNGHIKLDEETANKLRENHSIQAIIEDQELIESIRQRDYAKIISNPKFSALLNDRELLKQLGAMGLKKNITSAAEETPVGIDVPVSKRRENRLASIVYGQGIAAAVINDQIYEIGSKVFGGKIVEINSHSITIEFLDRRRQYSVGENIP